MVKPDQEPISVLVAADTNPKQLANSLRERYREHGLHRVMLKAMGPNAVNGAVKAVVELNKLLAGMGHYTFLVPSMEEFLVEDPMVPAGVPRTHIVMRLFLRPLGGS